MFYYEIECTFQNFFAVFDFFFSYSQVATMSDQETSRSLQNRFQFGEADYKTTRDLKDLNDAQCCANLSSPDSGMGNTIFSSPEKSDREGNDSMDGRDRGEGGGRSSPGTPHKIKLARHNVYGREAKSSPGTPPKDASAWNHLVGSMSPLSNNLCSPLKCPDMAKVVGVSHSVELNQGVFKSGPELQTEGVKCGDDGGSSSGEGLKEVPRNDKSKSGVDCQISTVERVQSVDKLLMQISSSDAEKLRVIGRSFPENAVISRKPETMETSQNKSDVCQIKSISRNAGTSNQGTSGMCQVSDILRKPEETLDTREKDEKTVSGDAHKENDGVSPVNESSDRNKLENVTVSQANNNSVRNDEQRPTVEVNANPSNSRDITESHSKHTVDSNVELGKKDAGVTLQLNGDVMVQNEGSAVVSSLERNCISTTSNEGGESGAKEADKAEIACGDNEAAKNLLCHERLKTKEILGVDVDMGIDLDAIRDTDSEAGESCCSEDQDACEGENGCIHQDGICDTEQNWDYLIDEEFNVPKRPVLNGSAEQLERRSNLKRKAMEEPEGEWVCFFLVRTVIYNLCCCFWFYSGLNPLSSKGTYTTHKKPISNKYLT